MSVVMAAEEVWESEREIRMSDQNSTDDGESDPQHSLSMVFLLVLVFFIMGLVGFLICHVLKKKGYRCRTFRDELDPDNKDVLAELQANEEEELNEDTVEKIVRCIIQNEANAEALKEMLGDNEGDIPVPVPSLCPHRNSQDGGPPHHHTVHLGSTQAPCIHCSKRKRHPLHRQGRSKDGKGRMHPGETTVFSVGRFRVTHIGKKPTFHEQQDGPLPDGSRELSTEELEHSSDRLQRERARNGTVPMGGLQNGAIQKGAQSGKGGEQSRSTTLALNTPVSSSTRDSRRGKGSGTAGSLQDAGTAPGSTSRQRKLLSRQMLGGSSPSIPGDLSQEGASICLEETGLGSADEVSDIHGSLSLHEQADELGRDDSSRKQPGMEDMGQQEPSAMVQDRGATV
ncbi:RELT-like protein 2 isoform X1 [Falco biarmicus]|uniref:RELT-like protein 2 isoform X1 n=1 Tax=Falco cherrug TaxID=345164 RepID=UPI0006B81FA4|nr:RELT-like protein 2 isoform X1 [Falco cherrug]XP_037252278.1 RELT-like protein 2 isoform X1 [Falco rusticolus]XP_037252280.1 RELT-like protein 2 isoform X1 [Falco rusticolus]XP_037252281.1 RELT-like protein 2 isoform X1 [Falco rusticolus]XP_037252282.1 RELT-like protein 2 isoform X1 [Falco rusticolus]XP_055573597.1 RELT-like protein 2 isoform X1 [Falco cherrug]XP_055573598.1 RELT-like protein 2 isoform X1 [Falco cherrug]XP_056204133.1 RELT-like protein 2 isoform X1 [Falco biarmicus]XP_05